MTALALSRNEFIALLATNEDEMQQHRKAELARMRECARLSALIAEVVDKYPGKSFRQVASELPPNEGTALLALFDELEMWSRETHPVEVQA